MPTSRPVETLPPILTLKEMADVFRPYSAINLRKERKLIAVNFPFLPAMNQRMRDDLHAKFNKRYKQWEVPLYKWRPLLDMAPEIQELWDQDWINALFREDIVLKDGDLTFDIPIGDSYNFPHNKDWCYGGNVYTVTHHGHPRDCDGQIRVRIYLIEKLDDEQI